LDDLLDESCPEFDRIDWRNVKTRLLIGATLKSPDAVKF
jgi:hypothetical protein